MNQILWRSKKKVLSLFAKFALFSARNVVERTIFLPIETPSERRAAPSCSPLLCYNLFIQAADNFCPWQAEGATESGAGYRVKNVPFPHWALWCFKHSALAGSPPGAQRGPHHIQFAIEPQLGTLRAAQSSTVESHTTEVPSPTPITPLFPLFIFLQLRQVFSAETWPLTPQLSYKLLATEGWESVNVSAAHPPHCLVRSHEEKKSVAMEGWLQGNPAVLITSGWFSL